MQVNASFGPPNYPSGQATTAKRRHKGRYEMSDTKTFKRHAGLVDQMANTLGLDLEEAMFEGRMDTEDVSDAVLSCTGCAHPDECENWLNKQTGSGGPAVPPQWCRNADLFERLMHGGHA